jgi:hypothetical protein
MARGTLIVVAASATGCVVGPQMALREPVSGRCEAARLSACDQLTRGAILYAEGDAANGRAVLRRGLAANTDRAEELSQFAVSMVTLGSERATGRYVASLQPAIALVLEAAAAAQSTQTTQDVALTPASEQQLASLSKASAETYQASEPEEEGTKGQPLGGFIAPKMPQTASQDAGAEPAALRACALGDGTRAWCVSHRVMARGYVTQLMVSRGCERDLFVLTQTPEQPSWVLWAPAGQGLSEHHLRLLVDSDSELVVGLVANEDERTVPDVGWRCAVTWAGTAGK